MVKGKTEPCPACGGKGVRVEDYRVPAGQPCGECGGKGVVPVGEDADAVVEELHGTADDAQTEASGSG